jgi:hypothetical protein
LDAQQREAIKRGHAPRFLVSEAGPHWQGRELLADHCEKAGMTDFQAEAALECVKGGDPETFARAQGCSQRTAKLVFAKVTDKLSQRLGFDAEKRRYWRDLLDCMKPAEGRLPDPLVGLMPMVDTENHPTWAAYLETLREPRNYRTVPLRGRVVTPDDLCALGV